MSVSRRAFLGSLLSLPTATILLPACTRHPQTPLAHLYGQGWVHGAYEHYAAKYVALQESAESRSQTAYALLAQKGIVSLDALQSREVPFHIRIDRDHKGFELERDLPERLTFTADMNDSDRKVATERWTRARQHVHTDYVEIRRLNWALTTLFSQLQRIRSAVENGTLEQYRLVRQIDTLGEGKLPFPLPYQVTSQDYDRVLHLLIDRLDDDHARLECVESSIVSVGLTARATDAGSASLAANLRAVLLAVVEDSAASRPRPASFPGSDAHDASLSRGRERAAALRRTPGYIAWLAEERNRELQQVGFLLIVFDQLAGMNTSAVFRKVLDIFSGNADYLTYLEAIAGVVPGGGRLSAVLGKAIETTRKVRAVARKIEGAMDDAQAMAAAAREAGVVNVASHYARSRLARQLSFFESKARLDEAAEAIRENPLMRAALPEL